MYIFHPWRWLIQEITKWNLSGKEEIFELIYSTKEFISSLLSLFLIPIYWFLYPLLVIKKFIVMLKHIKQWKTYSEETKEKIYNRNKHKKKLFIEYVEIKGE